MRDSMDSSMHDHEMRVWNDEKIKGGYLEPGESADVGGDGVAVTRRRPAAMHRGSMNAQHSPRHTSNERVRNTET